MSEINCEEKGLNLIDFAGTLDEIHLASFKKKVTCYLGLPETDGKQYVIRPGGSITYLFEVVEVETKVGPLLQQRKAALTQEQRPRFDGPTATS